jgi:hypothetical protein
LAHWLTSKIRDLEVDIIDLDKDCELKT